MVSRLSVASTYVLDDEAALDVYFSKHKAG